MLNKRLRYILSFLLTLVAAVCILGCEQINKGGTTVEFTNKLTKEEAERIHALTFEAAVELNENSDIDGVLLKKIDSIDDYTIANNQWGGGISDIEPPQVLVVREGAIDGYAHPYPYDTNNIYLTQLDIYSEKSNVFGIRMGDDISLAGQIMDKFGYILQENTEHNQAYYDYYDIIVEEYKKYDITIRVRSVKAGSIIESISVFVVDCNLLPEDPNAVY